MLRRAALFALPVLALVAPACAAPAEEEGADTDSAYSADDASCFKEAPRSGETGTDARARCLSSYASKLIDAQIAKNEDPRDKALATFKGKLRVGAETGCFTEDIPGGFTGIWQNDIDSERDVGMLAVQIKASIEFLKYFYRDLDGYPNHLFDQLEICPAGQVKSELSLTGSRLRVGVGTGWGGRIAVHTSSDLRDNWANGVHLTNNPALEQLEGMRWMILDPVGTARTTVRKVLRGLIAKLGDKLDGLNGKSDATVREEVSRIVREDVAEFPGAPQDAEGRGDVAPAPSFRDRALAKIASMSASQLKSFVTKWRAELKKTELAQGSEEGAITMGDVLNVKDVKIEVKQDGFVNVQNFKQIAVDADFFLPNGRKFSRFVETVKSTTEVKVEQSGTINIQLNDVINVRVAVVYAKTAQTASLDAVLGLGL